MYRSPKVSLAHLRSALENILTINSLQNNIVVGDFNVNWMADAERQPLYNVMVRDNGYQQLTTYTTDNNKIIDHVFTNVKNMDNKTGNIETYFTDHNAVWISCNRK